MPCRKCTYLCSYKVLGHLAQPYELAPALLSYQTLLNSTALEISLCALQADEASPSPHVNYLLPIINNEVRRITSQDLEVEEYLFDNMVRSVVTCKSHKQMVIKYIF